MKKIIMAAVVLFCVILMAPAAAEAKKISSVGAAKKLARNKVKGAVVTEVDIDYENGGLVYEVSLFKGSREYGLSYRASDGKLVQYEWESVGTTGISNGKRLTKSQIRKLAKKYVKKAKITQVYLDVDDGEEEYKVSMKKGTKTYQLIYAARTGKLMEYKWKISGSAASKTKYIGVAKAKSIAKKKVAGGTFIKVEFDKDDGVPVYKIEMVKGNREYELTIHAKTGKILEYDSELQDD